MGTSWMIVVALLIGELAWAVYLLFAAARSPLDAPGAHFRSGWLGVFGLMLALSGGTGLAAVLAVFGTASVAGTTAAVALNVALQPIVLLMCWTAVCKIALGVLGRVAYAWHRVPEEKLAGMAPAERRKLAWFCVFQGLVALPFFASISVALAYPLICWFIA